MIEENLKFAALKRLELTLGLINIENVVAWADEIIMNTREPHHLFYDISLAGGKSPKEVAMLLGELEEKSESSEIPAIAFRRFVVARHAELMSGTISYDELASSLYNTVWQTGFKLPSDYLDFCSWVDDEFDLVRQGIKDRKAAEIELNDFCLKLIKEEKA